jgi:HK97 gp10 family phage protein
MVSELHVSGLSELDKLLKELPAQVERNILRGAMRAGAKVFEGRAKQLVPVRSGQLRDSIKVSTRSKRGRVSATVRAGGKKAFYAHMVEFGTARHFIKPRKRKSLFFAGLAREVVDHPGSAPRPFMRPALDGGQAEAVNAAADYIRKRLAKEAAKK